MLQFSPSGSLIQQGKLSHVTLTERGGETVGTPDLVKSMDRRDLERIARLGRAFDCLLQAAKELRTAEWLAEHSGDRWAALDAGAAARAVDAEAEVVNALVRQAVWGDQPPNPG